MADEKEIELFRKFLETRTVLIVDANAAARSSLFNVMKELGAKTNLLLLANTYQQGAQQIIESKPHIVISEYDLGKNCGLDLLQSQREQRPKETKECLFIIVTGDTSQTVAARAFEEDVDAYIIKPYTLEYVRKTILKTALQKIKPPPYLAKIEEGKKLMAETNFDEAEKIFKEAIELDPCPTLAYYYLGQIKYMREVLHQAHSNYLKGLRLNNVHYKCLVGMYELLMRQKENEKAYEVVRKIAKYFPANPKRLTEVLRLAISIGKYEDIERYYSVFLNMDTSNETLVRYTTAALVICGKYYLIQKQGAPKALDIFKKAAITSGNNPKILAEIIPLLTERKLIEEAKTFLTRFPAEVRASNAYFLSEFFVLNGEGTVALVIDRGRQLLSKGILDARLYEVMIQRSLEAGLQSAGEDLFRDALKSFPDKKEQFEKAMTAKQEK